ncbi:MAG: lamin tail domain-containing protein, partial [bacterium]
FIRSYVQADPRKQYTNSDFETNLVSDLGSGSGRKPGLKSYITARQTSIQSQLNTLGISCNLSVTPGDVVINEFMASNDSIPDPAGEFEDWIELYNNTNSALDLSGLYLSDNFDVPTKWQFPANTIIGAHGYLIVWADEDSGQVGLHASFKLSAGGEELRISNLDASVVDTITFGAQVLNRTMARIPNGFGSFVLSTPTFNANNNIVSIGNEVTTVSELFSLFQNYPNPFNPSTVIRFSIPDNSFVTLKIYDESGREVSALINEYRNKGYYETNFDGTNLSSGIYYYSLKADDLTATKRMVLLK